MSLALFLAAAAVVWIAGIYLARTTDVLADRLHLGNALGGVVLLAVATNLPEIAITVSAALAGNISVAVGNILGGIAIQTVVLVMIDAFGVRSRSPLTYMAASLVLVLEGGLVVAVLLAVVAGSQLPDSLFFAHMSPSALIIAVLWIVGLLLIRRAGTALPWANAGEAPSSQEKERGHSKQKRVQAAAKSMSTSRSALVFGTAAVATLVAGVVLERAGDDFFGGIGLSGILFGSTVLAFATSLPEISTGLASARSGDYKLAVGDIFGGNAFLPVLFLVAELVGGKAVLPQAQASDIYLTAIGALLTVVYMAGLLFRPQRRVAGMGVDSLTVLILYAVGIGGLIAIT